jgi:hypothetical protein
MHETFFEPEEILSLKEPHGAPITGSGSQNQLTLISSVLHSGVREASCLNMPDAK